MDQSASTEKAAIKIPPAVAILAELRKAHRWVDDLLGEAKSLAIGRRRKAERAKGVELAADALAQVADQLEEVQRKLNPLELEREQLIAQLLAHWGHTGIKEIESTLGKTLITASFEIAVDPLTLRAGISQKMWWKITERVVRPPLLLGQGDHNVKLRFAIANALRVKKLKVSITSPSSRRPKSGANEAEME